jgi:hypothetical protein
LAVDLAPLRRQVAALGRTKAERAAQAMTSELKRTAPVDTGELRRKTGVSVQFATDRRVSLEAVIDVDYGVFVTQGTVPHVIRAKGRALVFYWPKVARTVFFKSVNHPGTAANPFFKRVTERFGDYLRAA